MSDWSDWFPSQVEVRNMFHYGYGWGQRSTPTTTQETPTMGMFDALPKPFSDHFKEDVVFTLQDAKVVTIPTQDYGPREAVEMKIDGAWYSSFGAGLVAQVQRMDRNDLPARVSITRVESTKAGRQAVKLFVPEGAAKPTEDDIPF